jgi:DNA-binding MarR family transcriptional regulator
MQRHQLDRIAEDLFAVAPQLHRLMDTGVRKEIGAEASAPQLRLLAEVRHEPQTVSALARQQRVSTQAICDLAHDLIARGWLTRVQHPTDRRQQLLTLTNTGEVAFAEARMRALEQLRPLLTMLSDAELTVVAAALPALQRVLSEADPHRQETH